MPIFFYLFVAGFCCFPTDRSFFFISLLLNSVKLDYNSIFVRYGIKSIWKLSSKEMFDLSGLCVVVVVVFVIFGVWIKSNHGKSTLATGYIANIPLKINKTFAFHVVIFELTGLAGDRFDSPSFTLYGRIIPELSPRLRPSKSGSSWF